MKEILTMARRRGWLSPLGMVFPALVLVWVGLGVSGRSSPAPGLAAALWSNGMLELRVTNGVGGEFYEIFHASTLEEGWSGPPWQVGLPGQTNFVVGPPAGANGFFKARAGSDWDGDGVPNWQDAQANDPNVGLLRVTIESPAAGAMVH